MRPPPPHHHHHHQPPTRASTPQQAEPELHAIEVGERDKYLIMGSDGLFDVLTNRSIAKLAGKMNSSAQKVLNELVREIKKKPSADDVTLVVVQFCHAGTPA